MKPLNGSHWKVRLLFIVALLIALYILRDVFLFMNSPYLPLYGEFDSNGFKINRASGAKSSEPLAAGTYITALEGIPVEKWLLSFLHLSPRTTPFPPFDKPLTLSIEDETKVSKIIFVFPGQPSMEDLLRDPLRLWLLAALILCCGVYLLFRYPEQHRVRVLSLLLLATVLSISNHAGKHLLIQISPRFIWIIILRFGTLSLIFSSWLYLILVFLERRGHLRLPAWASWMTYGLPPLAVGIALLLTWGNPLFWIEISFRILYLTAAAIVFFTFWILFRAYRETKDPIFKTQLRWILWGHALGMSPYILLYSLPKALFGAPWISYGFSLMAFPLIIFAYLFAFYRYRLMDVDRMIHSSMVYGTSVVIIFGIYLFILGFLLNRLSPSTRMEFWLRADLLILLGAVLVFNPLKNIVQKGVDRALFPERIGLPLLLMEGSNRLAQASNLEEIETFLLKRLPEGISIEQAATVLRDQFGKGWELRSRPEGWVEENEAMISSLDALSRENPSRFWDTLSEDDYMKNPGPLTHLRSQGVVLLFPMISGDDLWGFYLLGNKITNRLLSLEEIHVIETLCTQAAHKIGNARLLEGLQRTNRSLADLSHRLMQAERMADLGEGAATLAHELKNPLGIVRGSAEVLLKETESSKRNEILGFIIEEADRLAGTVDEFLQFARMAPPSKSEVDLNSLVQSATFLWESRRKSAIPVSIRFQFDNRVGKISLDSRQVYQALLNIFMNAEEATPEGGDMFISTGIDTESGQSWIWVKDTGKGITPEHLNRVFDRFFTTKDSGLGLGLTVVKKVMEAHGGSVRIESHPGNGTKVALFFPLGNKMNSGT